MDSIIFEVQGSSPEPYTVTFVKRSDTSLSAYCTCAAGENGLYCKHRFSILDGITKAIVSENINEVETIKDWLQGTDVESAITKMQELETEQKRIKTELSKAKKEVAKAMRE